MPSVSFHCDDVSFHWNNELSLSAWLTSVCENENAELTDLSYVFCSDEKLLEINRQFLNHDYYTDVITFDLSDIDESIEGEIYISLDRIKDHAENLAISFEQELCRVMAHGLLHLIGYDDRTPESKTEMTEREDISLSLLPEVPRGTFETQK